MENKKNSLLSNIIIPIIVLLARIQQGSTFAKTQLRNNKATFAVQEFKMSKGVTNAK